jgi:hypothetical protein
MLYDKPFTKENLDKYLGELAKEFKKKNRKDMPAEIVLIGGASVIVNYGFREMTYDMDALIIASSAMKDAIQVVGDKYDLPRGWLNDDFVRTKSFTDKIIQYSKFYRSFYGVLNVRTVTGEYLVAMKLKSGRQYKYDRSDVIGVLLEREKEGAPLSLEMIQKAVADLYGSYDVLKEDVRLFLENIMANGDYEEMYSRTRQYEIDNRNNLVEYQDQNPGVITRDNVDDIIAALRKRESK